MIDLKRYKRFFAFGCSFTNYYWPTWADIISKEMPNAQFYNLGKSGAGNLLISLRVAEANNRFNFTENDLVMVMFSTYSREDRYVNGEWKATGNVFTNNYYDKSFTEKYADEKGYIIRDLGLIDMTVRYLESLPCTNHCMLSVPFALNSDNLLFKFKLQSHNELSEYTEVYKDTLNKFNKSFYDLEMCQKWQQDYELPDSHPMPARYFNYLKKIGFNLSDETKNYVKKSNDLLKLCKTYDDCDKSFPELHNPTTHRKGLMF